MTWKLFAVTKPLIYERSMEIGDDEAEFVCEVFGKLGFSLIRDASQGAVYVAPPGHPIQAPASSEPVQSPRAAKPSSRAFHALHPRRAQVTPARPDEEVRAAIGSLGRVELQRLRVLASGFRWILAASGRSPKDLVYEAIARTLEGRRRWSSSDSLFEHLCASITSIASHWKKQLPLVAHRPLGSLDIVDPAAGLQELEQQEEFERNLRRKLRERGATLALQILERLRLGDRPRDVIQTLGIERKTYDAQVLKLRRYSKALRAKGDGNR